MSATKLPSQIEAEYRYTKDWEFWMLLIGILVCSGGFLFFFALFGGFSR